MSKRKISEIDASLGKNLAFFRKLAGLTQQQVAEHLNINRSTYTKYETGVSEPSFETLKQIADLFQISPASLLEDESAVGLSDVSHDGAAFEANAEERILLLRYRLLNRSFREEVFSLINDLSEK